MFAGELSYHWVPHLCSQLFCGGLHAMTRLVFNRGVAGEDLSVALRRNELFLVCFFLAWFGLTLSLTRSCTVCDVFCAEPA